MNDHSLDSEPAVSAIVSFFCIRDNQFARESCRRQRELWAEIGKMFLGDATDFVAQSRSIPLPLPAPSPTPPQRLGPF